MISSHLIISSRHVISSSRLISYVHPIYIAYLCRRVAVFCWLSLVSMLGRLGGVFVRFLVVLGGLRGVLGALLGVLGALGLLLSPLLLQRPRNNLPPFDLHSFFRP